MKISTRGRYAIRVMMELAKKNTGEFIPLMDIAKSQEISEKYLESIVVILSRNGLVQSLRGKGGGYRLTRNPSEYTIKDILELTEGSFAPVACLEKKPNTCDRASFCQTLPLWEGFQRVTEEYFSGVTIQDLIDGTDAADQYVI